MRLSTQDFEPGIPWRSLRLGVRKGFLMCFYSQTAVLNQAVKRNERRFPSDFMFRLTKEEKK